MGKRRGDVNNSVLVRDIAEDIKPYFDIDIRGRELVVKCVLDAIKKRIVEGTMGDRIKLVGFGVFDVRRLKAAHGRLRHFRKGELITGGRDGLKVRFVPGSDMKLQLKERDIDGGAEKVTEESQERNGVDAGRPDNEEALSGGTEVPCR